MLRELQAGRPTRVLAQTEVTSEELRTDKRLRAAMQVLNGLNRTERHCCTSGCHWCTGWLPH